MSHVTHELARSQSLGDDPGRLEAVRLAALRALDVLDTPREERFDRVTRLAQQIFDVPMVSVTLIDEDRQWRKSFIGLPEAEAAREGAFCDMTIRSPHTLVVPDAAIDEIFRENPFVVGDPHLRFYAGHPLEAPGGERIGTLCILDVEPRQLTPGETALLQDLAGWVERELTQDVELERAAVVQRGLLPRHAPRVLGYSLAASCTPARGVGGDFYDWFLLPDGLQLSVADVMGKGIAAAIVAASTRAVLRSMPRDLDPASALRNADQVLSLDLSDVDTFVTAFSARIDHASGRIVYADAGHGLAFVLHHDGTATRLVSDGMPLGLGIDSERAPHETDLTAGDKLLCFSDGLVDLFPDEDQAIREIVTAASRAVSAQEAVDNLAALGSGRYHPDDLTVVVVARDAQ